MIGGRLKRIIIQGAMNHDSGTEIAKLITTTAGIQKNAWDISAGKLITKIVSTEDDRIDHAINQRRNPNPRR